VTKIVTLKEATQGGRNGKNRRFVAESVKEDALGFDPGVCEQVAGVPIPWDLNRMHLVESW
jgi:hypothetical protein